MGLRVLQQPDQLPPALPSQPTRGFGAPEHMVGVRLWEKEESSLYGAAELNPGAALGNLSTYQWPGLSWGQDGGKFRFIGHGFCVRAEHRSANGERPMAAHSTVDPA